MEQIPTETRTFTTETDGAVPGRLSRHANLANASAISIRAGVFASCRQLTRAAIVGAGKVEDCREESNQFAA